MPEEEKKSKLSPLASKIINIVVDVIVAVVLIFALILAICAISSKKSDRAGYTVVFGSTYVSVSSGSMDPDNISADVVIPDGKPGGFKEGDLIKLAILSDDEKVDLEVGDVISFQTNQIVNDKWVLNTHRIVEVLTDANGAVTGFLTRGDANGSNDSYTVDLDDVIGQYNGKRISDLGKMFTFMSSSTGFFVCIVLPTLLVVVYCAVNLVLVILKERKVQNAEASAEEEKKRAELEEEIRQKLLAEMAANSSGNAPNEGNSEEKPAETAETDKPAEASESEDNNPEKKEGQD